MPARDELRGVGGGARAEPRSVEERGAGAIAGRQAIESGNGEARRVARANAVVGPPRRGISGGVGIVSVVPIELRGARPLRRQCRITEVAAR